ncbi:hypothetical protein Q9L58_009811 [Maublancomyces gigas]|uniref:Uncharacterized protein n=1 Tax=Discina gigas TaxID=1032678 RepID=A0ABR3G685_9PEZI
MFFTKTHLLAVLLITFVSASAFPEGCIYNGCICDRVAPGGYCGLCQLDDRSFWAVLECGSTPLGDLNDCNSWDFECLPDGGCCTYGTTKQCAEYYSGSSSPSELCAAYLTLPLSQSKAGLNRLNNRSV